MIQVKDNLLKSYSGTHKVEPRNAGIASDNYNYLQITIPDTLKENQEYTFCFKLKQFNGSREFSVMLYDKDHIKSAGASRFNVSDGRSYFNFIYREGVTVDILVYVDMSGETRGVGAEIKDMIIVEGYHKNTDEEVVYLPNQDDVKADNQAIFPIGGGYHEVYPL